MSVAKRTTLGDGSVFYANELMDGPDHLRILVPSDITFQHHLLYSYHNSPLGMTADVMQLTTIFPVTFIGVTCPNMCEIGFVDAIIVSRLKHSIRHMDPCKSEFLTIYFIS